MCVQRMVVRTHGYMRLPSMLRGERGIDGISSWLQPDYVDPETGFCVLSRHCSPIDASTSYLVRTPDELCRLQRQLPIINPSLQMVQ
jgi:hypothetical protein